MAKNHKGTAAPEVDEEAEALAAAEAEFDAEGGEVVAASGFAPYIKPTVGGLYRFMPLMIDATNPEFIRNVCQWEGPGVLQASTGPVASAEAVEVQPGELFTFSDYKGIPFELMNGLKVTALCTERRPMPAGKDGKPRSPMYVFKTKLSEDDAKTFVARKTAQLSAANIARKALAAKDKEAAVNGLPVSPSTAGAQQSLRS
jgi:hypothetical protein